MKKKIVLIALAAVGVLPFAATPAHAATTYNTKCSSYYDYARVCVQIATYDSGYRDVVAFIDGSVYSATTVLQQCDGYGNNCTTIAAANSTQTSFKPVSFGHTYKAVGSWNDSYTGNRWVNAQSPLAA